MQFNTAYVFKKGPTVDTGDELMTVQSAKEECDINTIVRKFGVTGQLPQGARALTYGDFDGVNDFQSAMNVIVEAQRAFDILPAEMRARFMNDPQVYLEFCTETDRQGNLVNLEEMRRLKLAVTPEPVVQPQPMKVEVVNPGVKEKKGETD